MGEVVLFGKEKSYPTNLDEGEYDEISSCGYNPDDPADLDEYWSDIIAAVEDFTRSK